MFALKSFKWISNIINFTKEITFTYSAWYINKIYQRYEILAIV